MMVKICIFGNNRRYECVLTARQTMSVCSLRARLWVCAHCAPDYECALTACQTTSVCSLLARLWVCAHCTPDYECVLTARQTM